MEFSVRFPGYKFHELLRGGLSDNDPSTIESISKGLGGLLTHFHLTLFA
jgi:hypothetical protein